MAKRVVAPWRLPHPSHPAPALRETERRLADPARSPLGTAAEPPVLGAGA